MADVSSTVFTQLKDGTQYVELPQASAVRYGSRLSAIGPFTATIPAMRLPDATGKLTIPISTVLEEGVHEIGVRRGGTTVWLGEVTGLDEVMGEGDQDVIQITANSLEAYPFRWRITNTLPGSDSLGRLLATDQAAIVKAILDHQVAKAGGGYANILTSVLAATTTGILRDRTTYQPWNALNSGNEITALANCLNGFDWAITAVDRQFRLYYPSRGVIHDDISFNTANIARLERRRDSTAQASSVLGLGNGTGADALRTVRTNGAAVSKYGLTETNWSGQSIVDPFTLQQSVDAYLATVAGSPNLLSATVRFNANLPYGSFGMGDIIHVEYPSPWATINDYRRVVGIDIEPFPDEIATVYLAPLS